MKFVFADTLYFLALLNERDPYTKRAIAFEREFSGSLVTSDWVLIEVADALAGSARRGALRPFIMELRNSSKCEIIEASRDLFDRALTFFHRHSDKDWTLTDCTSFVVMRDKGIQEALTGDYHFEQAGFTALLK